MEKLLVILGPTATGKTDLALLLARKSNGELISCDSRQLYIGLDIGTGKISNIKYQISKSKDFWEIDKIKVWMYDVVSPKKQYTVDNYVKDANRMIREIEGKKKLPIVVGGTGLYLKALLEGLPNLAIPIDQRLRVKLVKLSKEELQQKLQRLSLKRWQKMNDSDRQNPRRLIRAIELMIGEGDKGNRSNQGLTRNFDVLKIGLTASRDVLYRRTDEWVEDKIKHGMIDEAKHLHKEGLSFNKMKQLGLIYKLLADFLTGKISNQVTLIKVLQDKMHSYVRRQLTWFKKEKGVVWFDITSKNYLVNVENLVTRWYYQS